LLLAVLPACLDYLDPGQVGTVRFFGEVQSTPGSPLPLLPPISDRDGNAYVLSGGRDLRQVTVFTGQAGGGWVSGCALHKGDDRGAHGWVGRTRDHAWYWSGDALVEVSGETGSCSFVLDRDPASAASISFLGVAPAVRDAPSRTSVVALIQTPNDALPFWVVVDLNQKRYTQLTRFAPAGDKIVVLGTGAVDEAGASVFLVRYELDGLSYVEARYLDAEANITRTVPVSGLNALGEDAVLDFLAVDKDGTAAGVLSDGRIVVFNRDGGSARNATGMTALGVHESDGALWVAGTSGGPVIASIAGNGAVGNPEPWQAASKADASLRGPLHVIDDRAAPRRNISWTDSYSGIGPAAFLSASTPHHYAIGETLWLVGGPSYDAGGELHTQIALAPIGVSYP